MSEAVTPYPFRFDPINHEYIDIATGRVLPHITGMLEAAGVVDDLWFTEESSHRGQQVHRLTADYDLGALHAESCDGAYRGYLLAHIAARGVLQYEVLSVEEPLVHPPPRMWGGRPDRVIRMNGVVGILEIKTGDTHKAHPIQTALQAILVSSYGEILLRPEYFARWALYLKANGRYKLQAHPERRDFYKARNIIERFACR